jgi:DNA-binding CsgD family transcriptional regulator
MSGSAADSRAVSTAYGFWMPSVFAPANPASPGGVEPSSCVASPAGASLARWAAVSRQVGPSTPENSPAHPPAPGPSRELEVLRLLTDGASNPDISKALYISRRTTEHHVEHILTKLGVTSRTAAVAYALTHGLLT